MLQTGEGPRDRCLPPGGLGPQARVTVKSFKHRRRAPPYPHRKLDSKRQPGTALYILPGRPRGLHNRGGGTVVSSIVHLRKLRHRAQCGTSTGVTQLAAADRVSSPGLSSFRAFITPTVTHCSDTASVGPGACGFLKHRR